MMGWKMYFLSNMAILSTVLNFTCVVFLKDIHLFYVWVYWKGFTNMNGHHVGSIPFSVEPPFGVQSCDSLENDK